MAGFTIDSFGSKNSGNAGRKTPKGHPKPKIVTPKKPIYPIYPSRCSFEIPARVTSEYPKQEKVCAMIGAESECDCVCWRVDKKIYACAYSFLEYMVKG